MVEPEEKAGLLLRSLSAVKWNYAGTAGRVLMQLVSQIVLARLLGPEANGTFGYAVLVTSLVQLLVDGGLSSALVQAARLSEPELASAASRLALLGAAASGAVALGAGWIAGAIFAAPAAAPYILGIAPTFLIASLGSPGGAVLRRRLDFRTLQLIQLLSYLTGYLIVGIGMAAMDCGTWSLLGAWLVQYTVVAVLQARAAGCALCFGNPLRNLPFTGFGAVTLLTSLANWIIENATPALVGRLFGAAALGLFNMASTLVRTPANHLVTSLQIVLFSSSARLQQDIVGLRRSYLVALSAVAMVAVPAFSFAALASGTIAAAVLGPKWNGVADILTALALGAMFHAAMAIAGPVLGGSGRPQVELRVQAATAAALLLTVIAAATVSLAAVAWAVCVIYILRSAWMTHAVMQRLAVTPAAIWDALRGPVLASTACCLAVLAIEKGIARSGLRCPPLALLGIDAFGAAIALGGVVLALPGAIIGDSLHWLLGKLQVRSRIPDRPGLRRLHARLGADPAA